MGKHIQTLKRVMSVKDIYNTLTSINIHGVTNHHAYPVENASGMVVGMIHKRFVLLLIKNKSFYVRPIDTINEENSDNSNGFSYDSAEQLGAPMESVVINPDES
jgi:hypothetical protein